MKEITSKRTGKVQIVTNDTWNNIVMRGWANRFTMLEITKIIKNIPPEIKKVKKKDGQKN